MDWLVVLASNEVDTDDVDVTGWKAPCGGGVAFPESLDAVGIVLITRPVLKLHSSV